MVLEFLYAHEHLVLKKVPGKTWGGFCGEVGVSEQTVMNWFKKYDLPYSQTRLNMPKKSGIGNPLKKHTKPEVKIQLEEISEEIEKGIMLWCDLSKVGVKLFL